MELDWTKEERAFQEEVRSFLGAALTPDLRARAARQTGIFAVGEVAREWQAALYAKGWVAPAWPREHGGPGWSSRQRYIYERECAFAGAPLLPAMGLQMCGPILIRYGSDEQKTRFLPRILSGEHYWCQGFSEPQAGSDLSALRCRAAEDGDDYIINGTKLWTTHGHLANWMFMLVRTGEGGRPHEGVSFLLVRMDTPGISVRPILSLSGEHEVNQVFFDDVRVPQSQRVGAAGEGWSIARHLLEFERGGGFSTLRGLARLSGVAGALALLDGEDVAPMTACAAELEIALTGLDFTQQRIIARLDNGQAVGNQAASMLKLRSAELRQKVAELDMDCAGAAIAGAHEDERNALVRYLDIRAASIFGGTSEIQRSIIFRELVGKS